MDLQGVLQEVLGKQKGLEGLQVKHVENTPCAIPGDNYMSVVSVAELTGCLPGGRSYSGSVFVKRSLSSEERKKLFLGAEAFSNEGVMYQKALAKFHAGTFNLYISNKNQFTEVANLLKPMGLNVESNKDMLEAFLQQSLGSMEAIPGLEVAVRRLKSLQGKLFEWHKEIKKPGKIPVLYHGDCWINNMLIKQEDQGVSVKFVDLQASYLGSPMVDLLTFFFTSINLTVLEESLDELLKHYCESFSQQLTSLGTPSGKVPSLSELIQDFKDRELFGCVMGIMYCGAVSITAEQVGEFNLDEITKEKMLDESFMQQFQTNAVKDRISRILAVCMKRGVFSK